MYGFYKIERFSFGRLWNGFNVEMGKTGYNYMKAGICNLYINL